MIKSKRKQMTARGKVTEEIVDQVKQLSAADLNSTEINVVIERDHGFKISPSMISNILSGYRHSGVGNFTDEDKEYIDSLLDGEVASKPFEIDKLTKFGIVDVLHMEGMEFVIKHFKESTEYNLTEEIVKGIEVEVMEWIEENDVHGDNEIWFKNRILDRKKGN